MSSGIMSSVPLPLCLIKSRFFFPQCLRKKKVRYRVLGKPAVYLGSSHCSSPLVGIQSNLLVKVPYTKINKTPIVLGDLVIRNIKVLGMAHR
jgi:hypothetical protein